MEMVAISSKFHYYHYLERDRLVDHVIFDMGLNEGSVQFRHGDGHLSTCPSGQWSCIQTLSSQKGKSSESYLLEKASFSGPRRHS